MMKFKTALVFLTTTMIMMDSCNGKATGRRALLEHDTTPIVRPATQAGRFYEADPNVLASEVDSLLALSTARQPSSANHHVAALIVPHAGYVYSGSVAAAAYKALPPHKQYKRIFLLGPSHHVWLDGASVNTEADYYETPLGQVRVDRETAMLLVAADSSHTITFRAEAHNREHCLEVQLPFLQRYYAQTPPIVPIIIATNDFDKLRHIADMLKPYFTDENLFIISSDFSHYPSYGDACAVDARTRRAVESGDVSQFISAIRDNARSNIRNLETSACGEFPIITLLLMLQPSANTRQPSPSYKVRHIMYQNSGDVDSHNPNRVVGYHAFAVVRDLDPDSLHAAGNKEDGAGFVLTDDDKKLLKEIALQSIRDSLDGKRATDRRDSQSPTLNAPCGAFVSLHKHGQLRGCIGHFGEDRPLHEVVRKMARAAAFEDPRFPPLSHSELDDIDIEISVLTPMRRIYSLDEFQLHRHGIYIRKGYRSGTFLPQVADEVNWTKEEFVAHCSQDKAGLGWDGWRDAELYVYEAIVF
jgi:hypothetical protein